MKAVEQLTNGELKALRLYLEQKYKVAFENWRVTRLNDEGRIYLLGWVNGEVVATFTDRHHLTRVNLSLRRSA